MIKFIYVLNFSIPGYRKWTHIQCMSYLSDHPSIWDHFEKSSNPFRKCTFKGGPSAESIFLCDGTIIYIWNLWAVLAPVLATMRRCVCFNMLKWTGVTRDNINFRKKRHFTKEKKLKFTLSCITPVQVNILKQTHRLIVARTGANTAHKFQI